MNRDKPDSITHSLEALSVFRGIYKRVAVLLDVDPSYVSRVARGERHAPFVTDALRQEIQRALGKAGLQNGNGHNHNHSYGTPGAPLDGPSPNGQTSNASFAVAHSRDNHHASLDGHHARTRKKKSKTRTLKPATSTRKS
jgi:hypothetical protein